MQITYGALHEAYKIAGRKRIRADIKTAPHSIDLMAGQSDFAAFNVFVSVDDAFSLHVGEHAWFTQRGDVPTVRLACDLPVHAELYHEQTHRTHLPFEYADALLPIDVKEYDRGDVGGVYVILRTDVRTAPGVYHGKIRLYLSRVTEAETLVGEIDVTLTVTACRVRSGRDTGFYLDLWQHPSNIARHADVRLWSDEHFAVMEQYLRSLSALGQRALTLVVSEIPWSGQNCVEYSESGSNLFEFSIIPVRKHKDGTFSYDFSIMQTYIDIAASCGIRDELSLYGLVGVWTHGIFEKVAEDYPDGVRVRYLDECTGGYDYMRSADEIDAYVRALEAYFIRTGQIDRVRVAADEPSDVQAFRKSLEHLHAIAPSFKFKAAINHVEFIEEFGENFYDFVPYLGCARDKLDVLQGFKRTMPGKRFLWYTCCGPERPNYFLDSDLLEAYLIGILTHAYGLDGYLRWSYTVWTRDPMRDASYTYWRAGDMYIVYPGANGKPILSLRYYAIMRAIQLYGLLKSYRRRYGKRRTDALIRPIFGTDNVRAYDRCFSTDYAAYDTLRRTLLTEHSK